MQFCTTPAVDAQDNKLTCICVDTLACAAGGHAAQQLDRSHLELTLRQHDHHLWLYLTKL